MNYQKLILLFLFLHINVQADVFTQKIKNKYGCNNNATADFIVVGVGNAGAVMAKKLSDDLKTSVIALHNGKNLTQEPLIKFSKNVPLTVGAALLGNSPLYNTTLTTPQINDDNKQLLCALALPLGGATSINAGAYCRETNSVNAKWESIAGPNWSVARITKLYKELETFNGQTNNPAVHGYHGPIDVRQVQNPTKVSQTFNQAIINATGFPYVLDYNDPQTPIGASTKFQYTQNGPNNELRVSSSTAFLNSKVMTPDGNGVNGRKLKILFDAPALRTIWSGNKAIGVEYIQNGITQKVFANKGVIVCAGLNSSAFLMHSGVGPQTLLKSLNIPVTVNNPNVGQGLVDQILNLLFFTSNPKDTPFPSTDPATFVQIAWLPDPIGVQTERQFRFATLNPIPGLSVVLFDLVQPKSRGKIIINSADPLVPPVIDLEIFSNPDDLELYARGMQTYIKNINTAVQKNPFYQMFFPDPAILNDKNLVIEFLKANCQSNQCFQSHCRMAPLKQGGVVDSTGKVYGTQNLYVADDSIVPFVMDGTPMSTAYLIAANVADLIINK